MSAKPRVENGCHISGKRAQYSEGRYQLLFERNPLPMWVYDPETLCFLEVNDAAVRHYGYSREEFLRMTIKDIRPPEDVANLLTDVAGSRSTPYVTGLWRHRKKDGTVIDVEVTAHEFEYGDRRSRLVLAKDITDQLRAEAQVCELNEELEERVRERTSELKMINRELEAFTYSVSHDLRAPLRAIIGYSQFVLEDCAVRLDDDTKRLLSVICSEALRMGQLIDDLLAFSRLGRQQVEPTDIDMTALAANAFDGLTTTYAARSPQLQIKTLPTAHGDPAMLRQVLVNLLDNAIKFSSVRSDPAIEVEGWITGNENVYAVRDNGVGFDDKYSGKLFGVFERLHSRDEFPGTGVGLAIVQRILVRHGGRVWAKSKVDQGATFYFALPAKKSSQISDTP